MSLKEFLSKGSTLDLTLCCKYCRVVNGRDKENKKKNPIVFVERDLTWQPDFHSVSKVLDKIFCRMSVPALH